MRKKYIKKRRAIAFGLSAVMCFGSVVSVNADTAAIEAAQAAAAETESLQYENSAAINTLEAQKDEILGELSDVEVNIVTTIAAIDSLTDQITVKQGELDQTTADLGVAQDQQATEYEAMKKRIQYIYEVGGDAGWATILLSQDSIADFLNQAEYTQKMYSYDRECLENYMAIVQQVSDLKDQLATEKAELEETKAGEEEQEQYFEELKDQLRASSDDYDAQLAVCTQKASEYEELLSQQNAQIQQLVEEQAAQMAAAQAAAEEAAQQSAAQQAAAQAQAAAEEAQAVADQAVAAAQAQADNAQAAAQAVEASQAASDAQQQAAAAAAQAQAEAAAAQAQAQAAAAQAEAAQQEAAAQEAAAQQEAAASTTTTASTGNSALGQAIVNTALQYVGNPYVYGGNSLTNGIDCSGFTQQIYGMFGIGLSRSSWGQQSAGYAVSYAEAQPGDLICYAGHVAIYMGGGAIVHASNEINGICIFSDATYRDIVTVRRLV